MKKLPVQVVTFATVMGAAVAGMGIRVDALGAVMAVGFALMVMGWIQDDLDRRVLGGFPRSTH